MTEEGGHKLANKMSQPISMICRFQTKIIFLILLGFFVNHATVETTPNQHRRRITDRLISEDERDRKGAGK